MQFCLNAEVVAGLSQCAHISVATELIIWHAKNVSDSTLSAQYYRKPRFHPGR